MGFFDDIVGGIVGGFQELTELGSDIAGWDFFDAGFGIPQAIVAAGNSFFSAILGAFTLIANSVVSFASKLYDTGKEVAGIIFNALEQMAYTVAKSIVSALVSVFTWMHNMMDEIYTKFSAAIAAGITEVEAHVAQFASGVVGKMGTILGVQMALQVMKHGITQPGFNPIYLAIRSAGAGILGKLGGEILKELIL